MRAQSASQSSERVARPLATISPIHIAGTPQKRAETNDRYSKIPPKKTASEEGEREKRQWVFTASQYPSQTPDERNGSALVLGDSLISSWPDLVYNRPGP
jgi:hypothetical protein